MSNATTRRRVVVTGLGIITPHGLDINSFEHNAILMQCLLMKLNNRATVFNASEYMPARLERKIDLFTQYAIGASSQALKDSHLDLDMTDRTRVGCYIGNMFGGWTSTDTELRNLYQQGPSEVSAFQATSWFPAAPQGQISIYFGLKGYSKTVSCGVSSGLVAIGEAVNAIAANRADVILAGGTEAPLTPMILSACEKKYTYKNRVSEGCGMLVIEDYEHAKARGASIYAEIIDYALLRFDMDADNPECKEIASLEFDDYDFAISNYQLKFNSMSVPEDYKGFFNANSFLGESFGATGAIEIIMAILALKNNIKLCDGFVENDEIKHREIKKILVTKKSQGNHVASLAVCKLMA
jgi:3-oxoacyl-[acyl-carrier-protein] synthase II